MSQRQQSLFQIIAQHVEISAEALMGFWLAVATEEILALEALAELRGDAREAVLDQLFSELYWK